MVQAIGVNHRKGESTLVEDSLVSVTRGGPFGAQKDYIRGREISAILWQVQMCHNVKEELTQEAKYRVERPQRSWNLC